MLVRFLVGVVLVALVAWPERHRVARFWPQPRVRTFDLNGVAVDDATIARLRDLTAADRRMRDEWRECIRASPTWTGAYVVTEPLAVVSARPGSRIYEIARPPLPDFGSGRDVFIIGQAPVPEFAFRDAGLHVLLNIIRDVIDG